MRTQKLQYHFPVERGVNMEDTDFLLLNPQNHLQNGLSQSLESALLF